MSQGKKLTAADHNAEMQTAAMVQDLEELIKGRPEYAAIYCNTAFAAIAVLSAKYGLDGDLLRETYLETWDGAVTRILAEGAN